jgi:EmrB/QacA subfamily drug resistance transporter
MQTKKKTTWILVLYLLGLFMGALDTGIVTPARSVIQTQLGVNESIGIWMITIFTLAYAASIPITGKLADRYGSKVMYMVSIVLFGTGSLICALASTTDSFAILLFGRVIQAFGGGGIMPIVTAEIGMSFPPEKRGMALGLVGGVYGIANILGSSAGSAILGIAGNQGWSWLFLINVPISIFIVIAGIFTLENHRAEVVKKMDITGTVVLTSMILSLMYGLTNLKFFDFANSIQSVYVYPFILIFLALVPVLVFIEKRAADPILNLRYFADKNMLITYVTGILVGIAMMGMIFVPQFAENALKIKSGSGGYFVTLLGVFAGIGAPLSGKFVDKYGAKIVLMAGFSFNLAGGLFLAFVATSYMNIWTVFIALFFMGLGMGFTMGTPLNYMVLNAVPKSESNSALATLSLIRSIGTIISPAIMIGFLAAAGSNLQPELMNQLPQPPSQLVIRQVEEIKPLLEQIKKDPELMKRIDPAMLDIDKQMAGTNSSTMNKKGAPLPQNLVDAFKKADVTTIPTVIVNFADEMYSSSVTPELIAQIQGGIQNGIDGMNTGITEMDKASVSLTDQKTALHAKELALQKNIKDLDAAKIGIQNGINGTQKGIDGMNQALKGLQSALKFTPNPGLKAQANAMSAKIASTTIQKNALLQRYNDLVKAQTGMVEAIKGIQSGQTGMQDGLNAISARKDLLTKTSNKMVEIRDAVPGAFKDSKQSYLNALKDLVPSIQSTFQNGLNKGFTQMYLLVALLSGLGIIVLAFYKDPKRIVSDSDLVIETLLSETAK